MDPTVPAVVEFGNCEKCLSFLRMATERRAAIAAAHIEGMAYFAHLAEEARWPLEIRPTGDYDRVATHLKRRARGRGARRRAFEARRPASAPDGRVRHGRGRRHDNVYDAFKEFGDHLVGDMPRGGMQAHVEAAVKAFLRRQPRRSEFGAINLDALTVIGVVRSLIPQIIDARRWGSGHAARLYRQLIDGMAGRPQTAQQPRTPRS